MTSVLPGLPCLDKQTADEHYGFGVLENCMKSDQGLRQAQDALSNIFFTIL